MPRFFFDVMNGSLFHDAEGEEFNTTEAAKAYAQQVARELAQNGTHSPLKDAEVVVRDVQGECFRFKISEG